MDLISNLLTVALVSLLAAISPGPDFFVVVKNSISYSRKIGFITAFGVCSALIIHLTYTLVGIELLTNEGSALYLLLKYAGAAYLFYIGCKGFLSSFKKNQALDLCYAGNYNVILPFQAFKQGFLTNLLNPKCSLFFLSLFSQFVTPGTPVALKLGYACVNWSLSLGWFLFLSYLITGNFIVSRIGKFRMYIDRVMGCALMALSLKLIL